MACLSPVELLQDLQPILMDSAVPPNPLRAAGEGPTAISNSI
jgi:hypothetical protein